MTQNEPNNSSNDMIENFNRQQQRSSLFDACFVFFLFCIFSATYFISFFTKNVPEGTYITEKVAVTDWETDDITYLNLKINVCHEERGILYSIEGIISPINGKYVPISSLDLYQFDQEEHFKMDEDTWYSVNVSVKDVQISAIERIEKQPLAFLFRLAILAFCIWTYLKLKKQSKDFEKMQKKTPGN